MTREIRFTIAMAYIHSSGVPNNGGPVEVLPPGGAPGVPAGVPVVDPNGAAGKAGAGAGGARKSRHDDEEQGKLFVGGLRWVHI